MSDKKQEERATAHPLAHPTATATAPTPTPQETIDPDLLVPTPTQAENDLAVKGELPDGPAPAYPDPAAATPPVARKR